MKIAINPSDIAKTNEALANLSAAEQYLTILDSLEADTSALRDRVTANRRICEALLSTLKDTREVRT